ncbi:MAG: sulfite exporter TauE/SafE family protein, partial [Verrucomicrobia bacterium]|nr:sulfite exporter TauE/SafE family protein [Verrucomicrobiota bacterium]
MFFPISGVHINPFLLGILGFVIGVLAGFFGVGGSFLSGPSLFALGMPYNFVVGTDLIHIVGKSIVAARQHRTLGNIDLKLAGVMVIGTIVGSETGVQAIEGLKRSGEVNLVVGLTAIIIFTAISLFAGWESWQALRQSRRAGANRSGSRRDVLAFDKVAKA